MASGYEKEACGVFHGGRWSAPARRPWLQKGIDLAILFCGIGLHLGIVLSLLRLIVG